MGDFIALAKVKVKVKQFLSRPGQALRVVGGSGSQVMTGSTRKW